MVFLFPLFLNHNSDNTVLEAMVTTEHHVNGKFTFSLFSIFSRYQFLSTLYIRSIVAAAGAHRKTRYK